MKNPSTRTRWIGSVSFEAIGISQLPWPFTDAPIENSPPGIQTIPSGAGLGAAVLFEIVATNWEDVSFACCEWAEPARQVVKVRPANTQRLFFIFSSSAEIESSVARQATRPRPRVFRKRGR